MLIFPIHNSPQEYLLMNFPKPIFITLEMKTKSTFSFTDLQNLYNKQNKENVNAFIV